MRVALSLPPFGHLADPGAIVEIALATEEAGFDGCFLWDHVYRPPTDPREILDPWVLMGAMALATSRIRLGPMVTPLTRRRPIKLAREALTVDHLSAGRLTLGLGLGVDTGGELSRFGEIVDAKERGDRLDEGIDLLLGFWTGKAVEHDGPAYRADEVIVHPQPVQQPRIPLWLAARSGSPPRPFRRAARFDGLMPIELDGLGDLERIIDLVLAERGSLDGFDVMVNSAVDPAGAAALGATWSYRSFPTTVTPAEVFAIIAAGPWT